MKKLLIILLTISTIIIGCKKEIKKELTSFKISGMKCENGCANSIKKQLSTKEGVIKAEIMFKDSIASIEFNPKVTNRDDLMNFINTLNGQQKYTACEIVAKKSCCQSKGNSQPSEGVKPCCLNKQGAIKAGCKDQNGNVKSCCAGKNKANDSTATKKPCCANKNKANDSTATKKGCQKPCCANKIN